jgi:hypothetical protein
MLSQHRDKPIKPILCYKTKAKSMRLNVEPSMKADGTGPKKVIPHDCQKVKKTTALITRSFGIGDAAASSSLYLGLAQMQEKINK